MEIKINFCFTEATVCECDWLYSSRYKDGHGRHRINKGERKSQIHALGNSNFRRDYLRLPLYIHSVMTIFYFFVAGERYLLASASISSLFFFSFFFLFSIFLYMIGKPNPRSSLVKGSGLLVCWSTNETLDICFSQ